MIFVYGIKTEADNREAKMASLLDRLGLVNIIIPTNLLYSLFL
jgi:hypothetical protein